MIASPAAYRWALVISLMLGFYVAFGAAQDAWFALHLDAPPVMADHLLASGSGVSAESQRAISLASQSATRSAIAGMLPWRVATAILLAIASFAVVVQAFRLRFSAATVEFAGWLARAATAAAILRTIDGAQNLVITRQTAEGVVESMIAEGVKDARDYGALVMAMSSTASVVLSLLVVGAFLALGAYFRSDGLRALLARAAREEE